jgi:hypothetical protein
LGKTLKLSLALILYAIGQEVFSQDIIRPGLIRAQLTLSASQMLSENHSNFYLHGSFEGYLNKRLSLSGEGYHYLGNLSPGTELFKVNDSFFFGASWHLTKNNSDFYVGIQPGIAIAQLNERENNNNPTHLGVSPLLSSVVGYNYFVNKIFHFFIQTRIASGQHLYDIQKDLTEVRFSAGLGFNLNSRK